MSKSTISTFQLFEMFPTAESARLYLESRLWENGVTCPTCKATERITTRKGGFYRCNACQLDFTIRTGPPIAPVACDVFGQTQRCAITFI